MMLIRKSIIDLDWEYPSAFDGSRPTDKVNFSKLVKVSKKKIHIKIRQISKFLTGIKSSVPS